MADGRLSRRALLGSGLAAGAVVAGTGGLGLGLAIAQPDPRQVAAGPGEQRPTLIEFYGAHQNGVLAEPQANVAVAAYDLGGVPDVDRLRALLGLLTDDIARMMAATPALADTAPDLARLHSRLSVMVGFGPGLLARLGVPAPPGFAVLPAFPEIDQLDPAYGDGELLLHIAADDPLVVSHALRMLGKDVRAFGTRRWVQLGYLTTPDRLAADETPRNLFGQIDGSINPAPGTGDFDSSVWISDGSAWDGGTTLVVRRIRMDLDGWDRLDPSAMEQVIGRRLSDGAPLSGGGERDAADLDAIDSLGLPAIRDDAHLRLARAAEPGQQILRRPYTYDNTGGDGDVGQIFMSFQADIGKQYVPVQQRLAASDLLNEWTIPIGSAVFAIPPGCAQGERLGEGVL